MHDLTAVGPFGRLARRNLPCQWAGWCDWTPCLATCGAEAIQSRSRECECNDQIDPTSRGCLGDDHETKICGDAECPEKQDGNIFDLSFRLIFFTVMRISLKIPIEICYDK